MTSFLPVIAFLLFEAFLTVLFTLKVPFRYLLVPLCFLFLLAYPLVRGIRAAIRNEFPNF